jgi:hypothetical protein
MQRKYIEIGIFVNCQSLHLPFHCVGKDNRGRIKSV